MNNMHIANEKKIVSSLRLELSHDLEERYGSVREGFLAVDKNREGYIGLEEFIKLFDLCNLNQKYVERVFKKCDINNNGKISYAEFAAQLVRTDYPQGQKSSIMSPLTHNRRQSGRKGKRTGASALKYIRNTTPLNDKTTSKETYKAWDAKTTYRRILVPAQSTLPILAANNNVVQDDINNETNGIESKECDSNGNTQKPIVENASNKSGKLNMSSLDVNAKILTSTSSDNLEMQIFENGESKSVSFNISETNDPRNAALVLCEQQKIDPNAHVSTTLVEALAGKIAMARCKEGMIVVQKESSKQSDERTVLLEKKLREATDIVKRLSNALRDMRKAKAVNDRIAHHYKKEKRKENISLLSSPIPSPSYVKKPAVKIIIDGEGKAEFLNKDGELVDEEDGCPMSKIEGEDKKDNVKLMSKETKGGKKEENSDCAQPLGTNNTPNTTNVDNADKSDTNDMKVGKGDDNDGLGWKWSTDEKRVKSPTTVEDKLNGDDIEVVSSEVV
eukprot:g3176.t1